MPSAAAAADPVWDTWASVPWTAVNLPEPTSPAGCGTNILGWLKTGVPYLPRGEALSLQTLDLWIPSSATGTGVAPDINSLPAGQPGSVWIIYIHGGAWRDPRITSASFNPAATNLLRALASENSSSSSSSSHCTKLAGLVSLNYRLSPHPSHPSSDPARKAKHPDHISDVLAALSFLSRLGVIPGGANNNNNNNNNNDNSTKWILAGHSCGATLSFQTLMPRYHFLLPLSPPEPLTPAVLPPPSAVVGFNGLYDLAGFIADAPESHAHLRDGYREFTVSAFGGDESVWRAVCPASCEPGWVGKGWLGHGEGAAKIVAVLVQSREDQLVPWQQLERMRDCLEREGPIVQEVRVREARGEHDEIWREGGRMAEVLWEVVEGL
ncbi:uncharacterized protein B0T15DRAFT_399974 [Chaetomium strumarium]|uniref:Kynurenine formamidase n=1 Tax=Chaetomium strumarium TaxID=1170767 RepID=A0AAJ0GR61_9PEZI|nr:hypothetical protein B0T15DRAFT_399974 [Chaetomium strumarium]